MGGGRVGCDGCCAGCPGGAQLPGIASMDSIANAGFDSSSSGTSSNNGSKDASERASESLVMVCEFSADCSTGGAPVPCSPDPF